MRRSRQRGMTLIEVLVAFAILAGLSLGVLTLIGQNAQYMVTAEEKLLASIAADNLLAKDLAVRATPRAGVAQGKYEVAGRKFGYQRTVREIGERAVLIEFAVSREGSPQTLARASALKEAS